MGSYYFSIDLCMFCNCINNLILQSAVIWRETDEDPKEELVEKDIEEKLLDDDDKEKGDRKPSLVKYGTYNYKPRRESLEYEEIYGRKLSDDIPKINSEDTIGLSTKKNKMNIIRNTRSISVQPQRMKTNLMKHEVRLLPSQRAKWRHLFTVEAAIMRKERENKVISFFYIIIKIFNNIIIR